MAPVKHRIHLHGHLAKFGKKFELAVDSPAQAVRALGQLDGFCEALSQGYYRVSVNPGRPQGYDHDEETLGFSLGSKPVDLHFIPAPAGAKRGGLGKIIFGAIITVASFGLAGWSFAGLSGTLFGSVTYGTVASIGAAMMLSGLAQILTPMPKLNGGTGQNDDSSFTLGGQINQVEQGGPVPLIYGKIRVGSIVGSAGLEVECVKARNDSNIYQQDINGNWGLQRV